VADVGRSDERGDVGERRHLTVMFCDLVGSTRLAARLDPEDLSGVLRRYQEFCAEVVDRYDGHVAKYLGDGVLVFFGYPQAHEDDSVRAVHAALDILAGLPDLNADVEAECGIRLSIRIGVHSGQAVVEPTRGEDPQVFGHAINLAARLQGVAEPNSVVISADTLRLVRDRFSIHDLGVRRFKGIEDPVAIYRVLGPGEDRRGRGTSVTPLVGRDQELALLLDRWEQAREGNGQVVLLCGESGMGKTRLAEVLRRRLHGESAPWIECHCSPYHTNSAFWPVVGLLEKSFGFEDTDGTEERMTKLVRGIEALGVSAAEASPALAHLFSLPLPEGHPVLELSAEVRRRRTLEVLVSLTVALAERRPSVFAVEDLHWIDPSTLELLDLLVEQVPTVPALAFFTCRPSFEAAWGRRSHVTNLTLHPLTRRQVGRMVENVTGGRALPTEVVREVVAKTDGVPLFVEELTKSLVESDLLELGEDRYEVNLHHLPVTIPSTLQDSLMARLDRLGQAKRVAQVAAVIGREFSHELLQTVLGRSDDALNEELGRLVQAELLYRKGFPPRATYTFKHGLIQDAAYGSLLKSRRQAVHGRVAEAIEARFPERAECEPEVVARHYDEAGQTASALEYYGRSGERAVLGSAYKEAEAHLSRGLALVAGLPPGLERDQRELALRIALGPVLFALAGYGHPEIERNYERARKLCQELGEAPQLFEAVWGLANYYQGHGALDTARDLGEQLLAIAERAEDRRQRVWAHLQIGATRWWRGEYRTSLGHLERAIELCNPNEQRFLPGAPDPAIAARAYAGVDLCQLGHPDRAVETASIGIEMARRRSHPFSLGLVLCFASSLYLMRREPDRVCSLAEEAIEVATKHEFPAWRSIGGVSLGWALVQRGRVQEGFDRLNGGLTELAVTGTKVGAVIGLTVLADAYRTGGRGADAVEILEAGFALAARTGQRAWECELERLRGHILLERGDDVEAERCFRRALRLAGDFEAKYFELRAARDLARLLHRVGRKAEAREPLAERLDSFKEGLTLPDLIEAREVLREVS